MLEEKQYNNDRKLTKKKIKTKKKTKFAISFKCLALNNAGDAHKKYEKMNANENNK